MKINLKLRLKNKTTLISLIACIVAFIYQILGLLNIVPSISEATLMQIIGLGVNALVGLGVLVDPTTKGIADSERAMEYTELN